MAKLQRQSAMKVRTFSSIEPVFYRVRANSQTLYQGQPLEFCTARLPRGALEALRAVTRPKTVFK